MCRTCVADPKEWSNNMVAKAQGADPVQFGRWLSERRRALGWSSQRALADAAQQDPLTRESGITENFIARLEAGVLAWPPQGSVRRRLVELAWFLCDTPRAVASYLRIAGCTHLSPDERALAERISTYITASTATVPVILPPQPQFLIGREREIAELLDQITALDGGCSAISGLVGVGKSALAAEVVHRLAQDRRRLAYCFPDGIYTISALGRQGIAGVLAILADVCAVCMRDADGTLSYSSALEARGEAMSTSQLATHLNRVRFVLAGKRLLLVLDDVDPRLPLWELLQALLVVRSAPTTVDLADRRGRVSVLLTTRAVPDPSLVRAHLRLAPLDATASLTLFTTLVDRSLDADEHVLVRRLCATLAHVPFAIEQAALAARVEGIPLHVLLNLVEQRPFDPTWGGGKTLRMKLASAVQPLEPAAQRTLALLPLLGQDTFALPAAALLNSPSDTAANPEAGETPQLFTASALGQLVRNSLLEAAPRPEAPLEERDGEARCDADPVSLHDPTTYSLSPLVRRFAMDALGDLQRGHREHALENIWEHVSELARDLPETEDELASVWPLVLPAFEWRLGRGDELAVLDFALALTRSTRMVLCFPRQALQILSDAIEISRQRDDGPALARLLNRVGVLYYYRGAYCWAYDTETEAAAVMESLPAGRRHFAPYYNLAMLHIQRREYTVALPWIEQGFACAEAMREHMDMTCVISRLYIERAEALRGQGAVDRALADLSTAERLVRGDGADGEHHKALVHEVRIGQYRALGQYEQACALVREISALEHPTLPGAHAALDQAGYAAHLGHLDDARTFALRAARLGRQVRARFFVSEAHTLLAQLDARGA